MIIETDSYGEIEYEEKDLITFPDGIFGFPELKHYLLLCLTEGDDTVLLMLATDRPEIVFAIVNPLLFCPDYSPSLSEAELSFLDATDVDELSYYSICNIRGDEYLQSTVNLKCPLVIDPVSRKGMQVILPDPAYHYRHRFDSFAVLSAEGENARTEEVCENADNSTQEK